MKYSIFSDLLKEKRITGYEIKNRELITDKEKYVVYSHAEYEHIESVLAEIKKEGISVDFLIDKKKSFYKWLDGWVPSKNTRIIKGKGIDLAVESNYAIYFLPDSNNVTSLIEFLISKCFDNGKNHVIPGAWKVPYILINNIENPRFISTKEYQLQVSNQEIQSCFVPDGIKIKNCSLSRKLLFEPFNKFTTNI